MSTHAPAHGVVPGRQLSAQPPPAQTCGAVHVLPQPPQFAASLTTGLQPAPQSAVYGGHTHAPFAQNLSSLHLVPHAPQLFGSL